MKRKFNRFVRRMYSIRSIMVINFSIVALVAISVFVVFSIHNTKVVLKENSTQYSLELVKQTSNSIDEYIKDMEMLISMLLDNRYVNNFLRGDSNKNTYENIKSFIGSILSNNEDVCNVVIMKDERRCIINDMEQDEKEDKEFINTSWFKNLVDSNGNQFEISTAHVQDITNDKYQVVVTIGIKVIDEVTKEELGVIFMDLNYKVISNLCEDIKINKRDYIYIIDDYKNIIYHPKQKLLVNGEEEELIKEILLNNEENLVYKKNGNEKIYSNYKSKNTNWTTIGVSYTEEFIKNKGKVYWQYIILGAVLILIASIITWIFAKRISKPIIDLKSAMERVQGENIIEYKVERSGGAEIISLGNSFERMLVRINFLVKENIKEQNEKRNSEMRALQSQINPHFLYNTLGSVIWLVEGRNNDKAILMISALARLFRQAIGNSNMYTSIKSEIEYTRNYLTIQKMRYSDKFDFEIEIDSEVEKEEIIKLIIQPIVENSLYHGLKYKDGIGCIKILAYKSNDCITIQVNDNGIGIDKKTLDNLFLVSTKEKSDSVGIKNIKRRLELTYGDKCEFNIFSEINVGTTVVIKIPYRGYGEEN